LFVARLSSRLSRHILPLQLQMRGDVCKLATAARVPTFGGSCAGTGDLVLGGDESRKPDVAPAPARDLVAEATEHLG
jgi:hypothetical protein